MCEISIHEGVSAKFEDSGTVCHRVLAEAYASPGQATKKNLTFFRVLSGDVE